MRLAEIYADQPIPHVLDSVELGISDEHVAKLLSMEPDGGFLGYRVAPREVEAGWTWDGNTFLPPTSASAMSALENARAQKLAKIRAEMDAIDLKMARPMGAIITALINGTGPEQADKERLKTQQAKKAALREAMAKVETAVSVRVIQETTW